MTTEERRFESHVIERAAYRSGSLAIVCWTMRPPGAGPHPVLIYNHGSRMGPDGSPGLGQATLGFATPPWPGVAAGHCAVVFPEGRGYAGSEGPNLADCRSDADVVAFLRGRADDVSAARAWLGGQPWADTGRVALAGCSHGAAVSLLAGTLDAYGHIVAQAPGVSAGGSATGLDALALAVRSARAPLLFQHAEDDLPCPLANSETLHRAALEAGRESRLIRYPRLAGIDGHAQFDWANRAVWSRDFDAALEPLLGRPVACESGADSTVL